jgi:hypothetical protein
MDRARTGPIVVVAGANQAVKYWRRIRAGMGSEARPFHGTQSIDAAVALLVLADSADSTIHAWGYGAAVDPSRLYFYRYSASRVCRLRFISHTAMGNALNYSEGAARRAVSQLLADLKGSDIADPTRVVFVGCSWGAAVVDYGLQSPLGRASLLPGSGVAIGGPRQLLSWRWPRLPGAYTLSDNGDHGGLWVQRHPSDPIGLGGAKPALYFLNRRLHGYRIQPDPSGSHEPRFWGIDG